MNRLVLLTAYEADVCTAIAEIYREHASLSVVRTVDELEQTGLEDGGALLSFGTGVIVPASVMSSVAGPAWNLHPATPEFPGRDPHHHAIYRGTREFGATLHRMTSKVDDGEIVAVERFPVRVVDTPNDLMRQATLAGLSLLRRVGIRLFNDASMPGLGLSWGPIKTRRADLLALCRITPDISAEELERRIKAFDHPEHRNLSIDLHGRRFVLDSSFDPAETGERKTCRLSSD